MGSLIEINDILQITEEQGFPVDILDLNKHRQKPIQTADVQGIDFTFFKKDKARIYQLDPNRIYLVQNIESKWLFWGKAMIQTQTIAKKLDNNGTWIPDAWETNGTYRIIEIYNPDYQQVFTRMESPASKSFFD